MISPPEIPTRMKVLDFTKRETFNKIQTTSDSSLGGYSTVAFDTYRIDNPLESDGNNFGGYVAHFHGNLNLNLPESKPDVAASGWAMWKTKNKQKGDTQFKLFYFHSKFANYWWDFEPFQALKLRVFSKTNDRKFLINIQTDSMSRTDLYQHRLFLNSPGKWETVIIPLDDFVLTNRGHLRKQYQEEMEKDRIKSIGFSILDGKYGPYSLYIQDIEVLGGLDLLNTLNESRNENLLVSSKPDAERLEASSSVKE